MNLEFLIIHCTATPEGRAVSKEDIIRWHTSPVPAGRGWKQVGYSDMIMLDGSIVNLVPYDKDDIVETWEITNGVAGFNSRARHVVYVGGTDKIKQKPKDTRNLEQRVAMFDYVTNTIAEHPNIRVGGHNQFALKACPSFYVPQWLRSMGFDEKNIYQLPIV